MQTPVEPLTPIVEGVDGETAGGVPMEHKVSEREEPTIAKDVKDEVEDIKEEPADIKEESTDIKEEPTSIKEEPTDTKEEIKDDMVDEPSGDVGLDVTPSQTSVEGHPTLQTADDSPEQPTPVDVLESASPTTAALDNTPSAPDTANTTIASIDVSTTTLDADTTEPITTDTENHPVVDMEDHPAPATGMDNHNPPADPLKEDVLAVSPSPSPNRISISYAGSSRRLVLDADVVEDVKIRRAEGRIDITLSLEPLHLTLEEATADEALSSVPTETGTPVTPVSLLQNPLVSSSPLQNTSRGILASRFHFAWTSLYGEVLP